MTRAMFHVAGALVVAVLNCAIVSGWECDTAADEENLGIECTDIVADFMQELLDVPEEKAGRRLLVVDGSEITVIGETPGQQIAFLVDLINHGNNSASGWRLPPGRRLAKSAAGEAMADLIDAMQTDNDNGVSEGKHGRKNAVSKPWKKASGLTEKAMGDVDKAKKDNKGVSKLVLKHVDSHHWRSKMTRFFQGKSVLGKIVKNSKVLSKGFKLIGQYKVPVLSGLCRMASQLFASVGWYDVRALEDVAHVRTLSSLSRVKVFSLMAAGMVSLSAAVVAGKRQWSRWRGSTDPGEATREIMADVE